MVATKRKDKPEDTRPFFTVHVLDPQKVHQAIAEGKLPANCAPIDLSALARWAHAAPQPITGAEEMGLKVEPKEGG